MLVADGGGINGVAVAPRGLPSVLSFMPHLSGEKCQGRAPAPECDRHFRFQSSSHASLEFGKGVNQIKVISTHPPPLGISAPDEETAGYGARNGPWQSRRGVLFGA